MILRELCSIVRIIHRFTILFFFPSLANFMFMYLVSYCNGKSLMFVFCYYVYASNVVLQSGHQPSVLVWDCATLAFISELKGHLYGVECIAFSSDG